MSFAFLFHAEALRTPARASLRDSLSLGGYPRSLPASPLLWPRPTPRFAFAHPLARPSGSACAEGSLRAPLFGAFPRGLPSSLAELSGHAILLCPARALARRFAIAFGDLPSASLRRISFRPPKSIRWSPVGFMVTEHWPRGDFNSNETLRKRFTCVIAYPFVRRDSRTSVADYASLRLCRPTASIRLCTPRLPNCTSTSLQ